MTRVKKQIFSVTVKKYEHFVDDARKLSEVPCARKQAKLIFQNSWFTKKKKRKKVLTDVKRTKYWIVLLIYSI